VKSGDPVEQKKQLKYASLVAQSMEQMEQRCRPPGKDHRVLG
jgi:hypothetical protein